MSVRFLLSGVALLALTACGGGGGGGGGRIELDLDSPATFADLESQIAPLASYFDSDPDFNLQSSGQLNYDGFMIFASDLTRATTADPTPVADEGYFGQVDLTVNFANALLTTGEASNFFLVSLDSDGNPDGRLADVSGSLNLDGSSFGTFVNGRGQTVPALFLGVEGTLSGTVDVNGTMRGSFALSNSEAFIATEQSFSVGDASNWDAVIAAD